MLVFFRGAFGWSLFILKFQRVDGWTTNEKSSTVSKNDDKFPMKKIMAIVLQWRQHRHKIVKGMKSKANIVGFDTFRQRLDENRSHVRR